LLIADCLGDRRSPIGDLQIELSSALPIGRPAAVLAGVRTDDVPPHACLCRRLALTGSSAARDIEGDGRRERPRENTHDAIQLLDAACRNNRLSCRSAPISRTSAEPRARIS
jgi:hypothetical protein